MKIVIVYGSGGGNTEVVCEKVEEVLGAAGHDVSLLRAKVTNPAALPAFDLLILASPTYGHGLLENYMAHFMKGLKDVDLKGKKCCAIGLGDPKYDDDYHIEAAKILTDFLKEKEAEIVSLALRVSKSPYPLLNTHVTWWAEKLHDKLST